MWCEEHCQRIVAGSSRAISLTNAMLIRDLPMPGSPQIRATWPSPFLARSHKFINSASSRWRPTNCVSFDPIFASNRLSTAVSPVILKALIGSVNPFSVCGPTRSQTKPPPSNLRVTSETTTVFAAATS